MQLDSIIRSFVDSIGKIDHCPNDIPVMVLHNLDSFPAFYFTSGQKEIISSMYIFNNNRRIVGYIKVRSKNVIVLTTINSKLQFEDEFYNFIIPTVHTKRFDFIYFPNDMYCIPDEKGIPCPPIVFEPDYKVFIYRNNMIEIYSESSK